MRKSRVRTYVVSSWINWASWALPRRQMPRVRRRLVVHHPQNGRVHRVHAHHGRQLQQAFLAVPRPHGGDRGVANLWRLQQLPPEANDQRLVRRQAVQRAVRVDGVERLLTRASLQASRTCAFQMKSALDARAAVQIASSVSAPVSDVW